MRKYMIGVGLMMISTFVSAQRRDVDPGARATKRADRMKTELSLNDDQYKKVKTINETFATRHESLRKDTAVTVGTAHRRQQKLHDEHEAQIKAVLSESQWAKWTDMKTKRGDERKHSHRDKDRKG